MSKLKSFLTLRRLIAVGFVFSMLLGGMAWAQTKDSYGLYDTAKEGKILDLTISTKSPFEVAGEVIGIGLSFLGVIFFLIILYAGVRWMTAFGSSEKAEKAKDMLEAAAIGLAIVLASYALASFLFKSLGVGESTTSSSSTTCDGVCTTAAQCAANSYTVDSSKTCENDYLGNARVCCVASISK